MADALIEYANKLLIRKKEKINKGVLAVEKKLQKEADEAAKKKRTDDQRLAFLADFQKQAQPFVQRLKKMGEDINSPLSLEESFLVKDLSRGCGYYEVKIDKANRTDSKASFEAIEAFLKSRKTYFIRFYEDGDVRFTRKWAHVKGEGTIVFEKNFQSLASCFSLRAKISPSRIFKRPNRLLKIITKDLVDNGILEPHA